MKQANLRTNDASAVRDLSLQNSNGVIERGVTPAGFASDDIAQQPRVPANTSTEVAIVEGSTEPCSASYADRGKPTVANLDVSKASVSTHPGLMRAHQLGSITHADHKSLKCDMKCDKEEAQEEGPGMKTITTLASGDQKTEKAENVEKAEKIGATVPVTAKPNSTPITSKEATAGAPPSGSAVYSGGRSNPSSTVFRDKQGRIQQR